VRRALLDTSIVIAFGRADDVALPGSLEEGAISAMTLCELHQGVLVAEGHEQARRLAMLAAVEREHEVLPIDFRIAPGYARLISIGRSGGRKLQTADALIAATAAAHDLPLLTRDRDFEGLEGVEVVLV